MIKLWPMPLLLIMVSARSMAAAGGPVGKQTETVWRGAFQGDSLFVRATWLPTVGSAQCIAFMDESGDTTNVRPKFIDYRIEDAHGYVRGQDLLSQPGSQFCCDDLAAEVTPWRGGVIIRMTADGWGCEPAGNCEEMRYIYLDGKDSTASSEWTRILWNPAEEGLVGGSGIEGCIEYPMTLKPLVRGEAITFEPTFPPDVKRGDLVERPLDAESIASCPRSLDRPHPPTAIALYSSARSRASERLILRFKDSIEIRSAVIRAERSTDGSLKPRLHRLGIRVSGRSGYVTPADLRSAGFSGF